jgi:hypothetical protein
MNDRDLETLMRRNHRVSHDIRKIKKQQLHGQAEKLPPLEDWDLYDQMTRLRMEHVELRHAYDSLRSSRQLKLRGLAQISAKYFLQKIIDCINALDAMVWLLEDSGLIQVAEATENLR